MEDFKLVENNKSIESQYLVINPVWERQLQDFDQNLKLLLDKSNQRWLVAEFLPGNPYPNVLFYLEDDKGEPKAFGPWVLNKLFVKQERWKVYQRSNGPDIEQYIKDKQYEAELSVQEADERAHDEDSYKISHDISKWRQAVAAMNNEPVNDAKPHFVAEAIKPETKE